jgi:hypothetical protein
MQAPALLQALVNTDTGGPGPYLRGALSTMGPDAGVLDIGFHGVRFIPRHVALNEAPPLVSPPAGEMPISDAELARLAREAPVDVLHQVAEAGDSRLALAGEEDDPDDPQVAQARAGKEEDDAKRAMLDESAAERREHHAHQRARR